MDSAYDKLLELGYDPYLVRKALKETNNAGVDAAVRWLEEEKMKAERERRKTGREMQSVRQKLKEDEMIRAINQRNREKKEDMEYMKVLKMQIERDMKERHSSQKVAPAKEEVVIPTAIDTTGKTRIKVIVSDSERLMKVFDSSCLLSEVYDYVSLETGKRDFKLVPSFKIEGYDPMYKDKELKSIGLSRGASLFVE